MIKGNTRIEGYEFENEDVVIDFTVFKQCGFKNCNLIYYGHGPVNLENNVFDGCHWSFAGPAENTMQFLHAMYHGNAEGGRALVEAMIRGIQKP